MSQITPAEKTGVARDTQIAAVLSCVRILDRQRKTAGTGVVIGKDGQGLFILTARHLVDDVAQIELQAFQAADYPAVAETLKKPTLVAKSDKLRDLALLHVDFPVLPLRAVAITPENAELPAAPFKCLAVGCGEGRAPEPMLARVRADQPAKREESQVPVLFWELEGRTIGGASGGPLIDANGFLLGICSGNNKDKSYYLHVHEIVAFLKGQGHGNLLQTPKSGQSPGKRNQSAGFSVKLLSPGANGMTLQKQFGIERMLKWEVFVCWAVSA